MRPLRLELQGFTAFRQHTELDFGDLELFALVGPTGSGKSSLLDAMTFALYGQTARLGASGLDALISQGERGLSASLTFEVGGVTYRASRTKGRRQAENEVRFERLDSDGRWTGLNDGGAKGIAERIRRTVGLDFKTFTRSVMLPQGEFARLLHGTGKERQALLGELTGLEHVQDMHRFASDRAKELKAQSGSLNTLLDTEYAGVSADTVAALRQERETTDAEVQRFQGDRETLHARQARLRDQEKVWTTREDAARRLSTLQGRAAQVQQGAARATQARRVAGVLPLLDRAERTRIAHEREESELAQATREAQARAAQVQQAAAQAEQAQAQETRIPELETRADTLRGAEADAARLRRAGGTPQSTHPQPLDWDEDAWHAAHEAAQKLEKLRLERTQLETQRTGLKAAQDRLKADQQTQAQDTATLERLGREGKAAKTDLEAAQHALDEARQSAGLAAHRAHLHVGEPCPLCLQVVQALPQGEVADLHTLEDRVQVLGATLEDRRGRYSDLRGQVRSRDTLIADKKNENADWEAQLTQRDLDLRQLEAHITGDPLALALRYVAGLAARVRSAGADPAGARKATLAEIAAIRTAIQGSAAALARAQGDEAAAQATLHARTASAQERETDWQEAQTDLSRTLSELKLSAEQARAAALPEADIAALEAAAQQSAAQIAQLREQVAELERQLGVAPFDPAELVQVSRDLSAAEASLSAALERAGRLAEQERAARAKLDRRAEIEAQAKAVGDRFDTWQTLSLSLRTNEFQQFLLAEIEGQLLTRAGILLFEISDGRYRLTLQDQDYVVQDLWNAGEVRGVKTLSGGETFLASLSLAIALSDYLAGNKILGALFLDEGFGTLDPQALEAVAGALENLRTQGRMVGVVTHVESLSERLPSRLLVTKSVAGSSVQRLDG